MPPSRILGAVSEGPRPTRRLEAASALWTTGEATCLVGLIVYAFDVGGAPAVALVALLQSLPSAVLVPLITAATGRVPRARLLAALLGVRALSVGVAAAILMTDGPAYGVFLLAAVDGLGSTLLRPIRGALVPMIARSPEELVKANVGITTGMSAAALVGPAVAAAALAVGGVEATFLIGTVTFIGALDVTLRLRTSAESTTPQRVGSGPGLAGLRTLADLPAARTVVGVIVAQRFARGMITVLVATTALELLGTDDSGVGLLSAAIGFGGLVGSVLSVGLVGRPRLAPSFAGAIGLWGVCLGAPAVAPFVMTTIVFFAVGGAGKAILEVAGTTLLQRTVPAPARSQVLALVESFVTAALAAGAVVASALVQWLGPAAALVGAGGYLVGLTVVSWPRLRLVDDAVVIPQRELGLLRGVSFFRPLQLTTIEDLAGRLRDVRVPAATDVVRQGEHGEDFYIVDFGRLETEVDGRRVGTLGPGDSFGEIALLRDVPRTATVRSVTEASLVSLSGEEFLAAVSGHTDSAAAAEAVVTLRMGTSRPGAASPTSDRA